MKKVVVKNIKAKLILNPEKRIQKLGKNWKKGFSHLK
jgi:hypothetical protein